jgi:hypothetical protein
MIFNIYLMITKRHVELKLNIRTEQHAKVRNRMICDYGLLLINFIIINCFACSLRVCYSFRFCAFACLFHVSVFPY